LLRQEVLEALGFDWGRHGLEQVIHLKCGGWSEVSRFATLKLQSNPEKGFLRL
jgi:hypothetical protein